MSPYLRVTILSAGYRVAQLAEHLPCMRKAIINPHHCTRKNRHRKSRRGPKESQMQDLDTRLSQHSSVVSSLSREATRAGETSVSGL